MNDQTARVYDGRYRGKRVLLVGSGNDVDGRAMGEIIDGDTYDIVARVNKHYGDRADVGNRTDVIISRWLSWLDNHEWFSETEQALAKEVVILNQHVGYSESEYRWLCERVGHEAVSAGIQAIDFFLNRGVSSIDVIGFGFKGGVAARDKVYTKGSANTTPTHNTTSTGKDCNPTYDWHAERLWEVNQARVHLL